MLTRRSFFKGACAAAVLAGARRALALEQRDDVGELRGPYRLAFYRRHNPSYRLSAAMHFFHSKEHDLLLQTLSSDRERVDREFDREALERMRNPPRIEPKMAYYSERVARSMYRVFRAIDWTHMHHEQTYDVLSDAGIPWAEKRRWTDRAVRYYLEKQSPGIPRSCAPLDVTMRRAAVMMKPYFTLFRGGYPLSNDLFYVAHWWHPIIYEAMMVSGNGGAQELTIAAVNGTMWDAVVPNRPQRMVLSREAMPRYSRLSPESANIFDNLHMLHGLVYDILAYEGWSLEQQRTEIYRVVDALGYHSGDEKLARKFSLPDPEADPRKYGERLRSPDGEMTRIMREMLEEMMPSMMPGASAHERERAMSVLKAKGKPGVDRGETPGSLHDAFLKEMPGMKVMPGSTEPGQVPRDMVETMLEGWRAKHGGMPDVPELDMSREPSEHGSSRA